PDPVRLCQAGQKGRKGGRFQMTKSSNWESTIKPILVLTLSSLVASLMLALVNSVTAPVIEANQRAATLVAYVEVLPTVSDGAELEEVTDYTTAGVTGAVRAPDGSIAVQASESGYNGGMVNVIIGFDTTGTMTGIHVDASSQTSGIGTNVALPDYLAQFDGLTAEANITKGQGYDAVTGATYSTDALFAAINDCINCYNELA